MARQILKSELAAQNAELRAEVSSLKALAESRLIELNALRNASSPKAVQKPSPWPALKAQYNKLLAEGKKPVIKRDQHGNQAVFVL